MSTYETLDLAPYIVTGFMLPVGDVGELSQTFFCMDKESPNFTHMEEDEYDKRFVELGRGMEAFVSFPYPFQSDHRFCGCTDLCMDICVDI